MTVERSTVSLMLHGSFQASQERDCDSEGSPQCQIGRKNTPRMKLIVSPDDQNIAYLSLPGHPGSVHGVVKKSVQLVELLGSFHGPEIILDFDSNELLIGIEILGGDDEQTNT